jgi:hypothetical protein
LFSMMITGWVNGEKGTDPACRAITS